jgi:predicted O-methyltransferase YrrM
VNLEMIRQRVKPRNLINGIRYPTAAWQYLRRASANYRGLAECLGVTRNQFTSYFAETRAGEETVGRLWATADKLEMQLDQDGHTLGALPRDLCELVYAIVRSGSPAVVLETGVGSGMSSSYILAALEANHDGQLYSVDLPGGRLSTAQGTPQYALSDNQAGWLVPDGLRGRWHLTLGESSEVLPGLLDRLGHVDVFLHDSGHSYENMMAEYQIVWPHLKPDGVLLSDNIDRNKAFRDFSIRVVGRAFAYGRFGALVKARQ